MAITWTIIVLGVLLPVMDSQETTTVTQTSQNGRIMTITPDSSSTFTPANTLSNLASTTTGAQANPTNPTTPTSLPQPTTQPITSNPVTTAEYTAQTNQQPRAEPEQFYTRKVEEKVITTTQTHLSNITSDSVLTSATQPNIYSSQTPSTSGLTTTKSSNPVTETSGTQRIPLPDTTVTLQSSADPSQQTTDKTTQVPTDPELPDHTKSLMKPEPDSTTKLSTTQQPQTTQTTIITGTSVLHSDASRVGKEPGTSSTKTYDYNNNNISSTSSKESVVHEVVHKACKTLLHQLKGNCSATVEIKGKELIIQTKIDADQHIPTEIYEPPEQKKETSDNDSKWMIPDTLIAILASCGALVLILCFFAAYCTYHRRSYRKNQQHLTEEMQTVENGYHDNPTLEVMEVQPEMQEKKVALNGEFNDSWIVPIDNLLKEDIPDEEDTHL